MKHIYLRWSFFSFLCIIGINKLSAQSPATVTSDSINTITATTVIGYGNITSDGGDHTVTSGLCYSTSPNPTTADSTIPFISTGAGAFNATISSLIPNTTYYVIAYAINGAGTSYGTQLQFTTAAATLATVTSDSINSITDTTAQAYGNITNNGNDPNVTSGLCYSTSPNPTTADSTVGFISSDTGSFNALIFGLTSNTTYYVKAYATNIIGTSYGSQLSFTTKNLVLATVTSDSIISITDTTAVAYGNVTANGNDPATIGGFCYSTSPNPTIADSTVGSFNGTGSYSTTLTSLTLNTTYYVRAYATNAEGTAYGSQLSFTTKNFVLATVTSDSIISITDTTAVAYGNVTANGNDPNATGGFCYSTSPNPTIADSTVGSFNGTGSYGTTLTSLTLNTTYYVRAYTTNAEGTAYGTQLSFTTKNFVLATVTSDSIISITDTTAVAYGNVTANGNDPNTTGGFCYSTSPNPTIADITVGNFNGTGLFNTMLSGLTLNTTYYVRAYVTNTVGTAYGSELSFITKDFVLPTLTTDSVISITDTTAVAYGNVTANGNDPNTTGGFCYSTSPNPTIADSTVGNFNSTGSFNRTLSNLTINTTYYVRAYANNAEGTAYGNQLSFTTKNFVLATVTTNSINSITNTTAQAYGNITNNGNDPATTGGFCYSTSPNPTIADSTVGNFNGPGSFNTALSGLTLNTTYYIRAYATNTEGTSYGSSIQFTTTDLVLPIVTTDSITTITDTTAVGYANITNNGNDPGVTGGLCYSKSPNPTIADSTIGNFAGTGLFNTALSNLTLNTTYYVRAYATNTVGTAYGNQLQFTTKDFVLATVTTNSITGITDTAATAYGSISANGNDPATTGGICYSTLPNPTIGDSIVGTFNGIGSFNTAVFNLTLNTTYYVRAYATNIVGTAYGNQLQFTTKDFVLATVTTDSIDNITATTAVGYGTITNGGNDPSVTGGLCYSKFPNPTIANTTVGNYNGTGSFNATISGLSPNTVYYVRAYATDAEGTSYGNQTQFTTQFALPTVTTDSIDKVLDITAHGYGNITYNGGDASVTGGLCYSKSPNPTIADSTIASGSSGTGSFTAIMSGLTSNVTYYVRAYATNPAGTSYGTQLQFTTLSLPTVTTDSINAITTTSVKGYGNITSNGNDPNVIGGLCFSKSPNPTLADSSVTKGSIGAGAFSAKISGLTTNTTYYVRAYATNAIGTVYGSQIIPFTTANIILPVVTTDSIENISATTAVGYGNITNNGGYHNVTGGLCYSKSPNPTTADNTSQSISTGTGSFSVTLSYLTPNTTYYVRAYASNNVGTAYGNQITFTTATIILPVVTTDSITNVTANTAIGYGTITNDGHDPNASGGLCYSTSPNPTTADNTTGSVSNGTGPFLGTIYSNLNPNTTYYVRAYATNPAGTSYGQQLQFTTGSLPLPVVTTDSITNITPNSAFGYGNITNTGGDPNVTGGICYGTSPNPTTANNTSISNYNGAGSFYTTITGLQPNTTYYVKAFATNISGTAYGTQLSFTTSMPLGIETISSVNTELNLSPNPTNRLLTVSFVSEENSEVKIDILNSLGAAVNLSKTITAITGNNSVTFDLSTIASGVYFVRVTASGKIVATQKIIKTE